MKYLKEVLISAGDIDKYYDDLVPVNLWRAKNLSNKEPIFSMVEHKIVRNNGKVRRLIFQYIKTMVLTGCRSKNVPGALALLIDLMSSNEVNGSTIKYPLGQYYQMDSP